MNDLISVEQVYGILLASIRPVSRIERLPLEAAAGCVLAEAIHAPADHPPFTNSAMDGFAFSAKLLEAGGALDLPVAGASYAGRPWEGALASGEALRIMTGAAVPAGADTVIPFERVTETQTDAGARIAFSADAVRPGDNVRLRGEEMRAGDVVMAPGTVLTPDRIGLAASLGAAELAVRRIRVAVFSTGDELAAPGTPGPLGPGRIWNANSPLISALARSWGAEVTDLGILPDNPEAIRKAIVAASAEADFIVTSGGVGEGERDFTSRVLAEMGAGVTHYYVRQRPGKPLSFGRIGADGAWFMALPGNPVAAAVSARLYLKRAILLAAGASGEALVPQTLPAVAGARVKGRTGRTDFVRGVTALRDGVLVFTPAANQGSGMLTTIAGMNAMAVLPEDRASAEAGEALECLPL